MNVKNKAFNRYYLLSCLGVLIASYYPLSMGVRVTTDMLVNGTVMKENYPKYIIPYTPISVAIIAGVLLMPLFIKVFKRFAFAGGAAVATGVFFGSELLFEQKVVVSTAETVIKLEDWQMYMCYVPPEGWGETVTTYKTQTAVDILMGDYNPAFKLHFYIISIVLIITILNCLYGFGQMIKNGDKKRCKSLILQSVCSLVFLGLCILACFTAFWRDGSIQVSPLSASLMSVFFILLGVTVGVFLGSFLLGKRKLVSIWIPAISASMMTFLMYIAEMFLLNGHLYSFGSGLLLYSGAMSNISDSVMEASQIDGAGELRQFFTIVVPLIFPTLSTFLINGVAVIFSSDMHLYAFFGGGADRSAWTFGYYLLRMTREATMSEYPFPATVGIFLTVFSVPITFLFRYMLNKLGPKTV